MARCQAAIVRIGLGQVLPDGKAGPIGGERVRKVILRDPHVADPVVGDREVALPVVVVGTGGNQIGHDLPRLLRGRERTGGVADRLQRSRHLAERRGLAVFEVRRDLIGFRQLLLQAARAVENVFDDGRGNSDRIAEALRHVEDERVGGLGRGRERVFGALALLVGDLPLLHGDAALPVGEAGQYQSDQKAGGEAAGEDVAPPRRAAAALGDEGLRLLGRRRRVGRPRGDPAFGLLQHRRAQQQPAGAAGRRPLPRGFAIGGVLPDPADVGLQRIGEPVEA